MDREFGIQGDSTEPSLGKNGDSTEQIFGKHGDSIAGNLAGHEFDGF